MDGPCLIGEIVVALRDMTAAAARSREHGMCSLRSCRFTLQRPGHVDFMSSGLYAAPVLFRL
jgi:hypothetical protein